MLNEFEWTGLVLALALQAVPGLFYWICIVVDFLTKNSDGSLYWTGDNNGSGTSSSGRDGDFTYEPGDRSWAKARFMDCLLFSREHYRSLSNHCSILIPLVFWPYVWFCIYVTRVVYTFYVWRDIGQYPEVVFGFLITLPIATILFELTWSTFLFRFRMLTPALLAIITYAVYFITLFGLKANYSANAGLYVTIPELLYCLYLTFVGISLLKDERYSSFMSRSPRDYVVSPVLTPMYSGSTGVSSGEVYGDHMSSSGLLVESNTGERKVITDPVVREIVMAKMGIRSEYGRGSGVTRLGHFVNIRNISDRKNL